MKHDQIDLLFTLVLELQYLEVVPAVPLSFKLPILSRVLMIRYQKMTSHHVTFIFFSCIYIHIMLHCAFTYSSSFGVHPISVAYVANFLGRAIY